MKQYKKQVDGYKVHNAELMTKMEGLKTELGVYQQRATHQRQQVCMKLCIPA